MSDDERRLAAWLHGQTPNPPREVTVEQVARRVAHRPRRGSRHRWLPLAAAAGMAAIAAATAVIVNLPGGDHQPPTTTTTPRPSPTASSPSPATASASVSVSASVLPSSIDLGSWSATPVGGAAAHATALLGADGSLYAADGADLVRLDPATGAVLARRPVSLNGDMTDLALMSGTLWINPSHTDDGTAVMHGYDPETLTPTRSVRLSFAHVTEPLPAIPMTAAPNRGELFLGLGRTIDVVDAATGQVAHRFTVTDGPIIDVAVDPDGSRLYVGVRPSEADFRIDVLDSRAGAQLSGTDLGAATVDNNIGLVPSTGGVWLHAGGGHVDDVSFLDTPALKPAGLSIAGAVRPLTITVADDTVWIDANGEAWCADPRTGRKRASTLIPPDNNQSSYLGTVTDTGGQLFSTYRGADPNPVLVRLRPSKKCTPS